MESKAYFKFYVLIENVAKYLENTKIRQKEEILKYE